MPHSRKKFLQQITSGLILAGLPSIASAKENNNENIDATDFAGEGAPDDEKFWKRIARKYYDTPKDYINLENGYYGMQPKPVLQAFQKNIEKANKQGARFARKEYPAIAATIKKELAAFLNVADEEIIITRNATEALNIAIQGYPFSPGDEVLLNQLDYFSMIETFQLLEKRGQLTIKAFDMPLLPTTEEEIVEVYKQQLTAKTKIILLTHVSNINGLIVPVAKIAAMARQRGIDIICDSAHALGHLPFSLPDLGANYVGLNLHKWIGNPVGAGVLYIKKEKIAGTKALFGDVAAAADDIRKLAHFGTTPFAVVMTIPDSLAFHQKLGVDRIAARLHYLKSQWVQPLIAQPGVEIVTPAAPQLSGAIASFRITGKTATQTSDILYTQHNIMTVGRTLGPQGCVRVTPSIFNATEDCKKLVAAVKVIAGS